MMWVIDRYSSVQIKNSDKYMKGVRNLQSIDNKSIYKDAIC